MELPWMLLPPNLRVFGNWKLCVRLDHCLLQLPATVKAGVCRKPASGSFLVEFRAADCSCII